MRPIALVPLAIAAVLALGACGKGGGTGAAAGSSAAASANGTAANAAAVEAGFQFQPGKYRTTVEIQKVELPGMPAAVAAAMKSKMAGPVMEYCLKPEDAAKGLEVMKQHMAQGQCQFDSFNASGGTVDSSFTCNFKQGGTLHSVSHGTYTDTGSKVSSSGDMATAGGKGMHIEQITTTTRVGDCAG